MSDHGIRGTCRVVGRRLKNTWDAEFFHLFEHGSGVLVAGAEMAFRIGQSNLVHTGETVIFVVDQATVANKRPQHAAEHALFVAVFRIGPAVK